MGGLRVPHSGNRLDGTGKIMSAAVATKLATEIVNEHKDEFSASRVPIARWELFFKNYAMSGLLVKSLNDAGMHFSTVYKWKNEKPWFRTVMEELETVMVERVYDTAKTIAMGGTDTRFIQWFLEKMRPDQFNPKIQIDSKITHSYSDLTTEEIKELLRRGEDN